jgi:hypothetical protein
MFTPHNISDGDTCRSCVQLQERQRGIALPFALKQCEVCTGNFNSRDGEKRCPSCRRLAQTDKKAPVIEDHYLAPPLTQAVFDLETWGLDRGWGVLMVACIMVHGKGKEPVWHEFDLTQSSRWPDVRTDDSELAAKVIEVLSSADVLYAHNGKDFDLRFLNSISLKYNLPRIRAKLIDPVQIARRQYRIGSNALGSLANFLGLQESKMPVAPDTWRYALMDNDPESWQILRERCKSDVRLLNQVAAKVTKDVGMIDQSGSAWR